MRNTTRRRTRESAPIAPPSEVREILDDLRRRYPDLFPDDDSEMRQTLHAIRRIERYPASVSGKGRPGRWNRDKLLEASSHLKAELWRRYRDRISLSTFINFCIPTLDYPDDIIKALESGRINRQEAAMLARLTAARLQASPAEASSTRRKILKGHLQAQGSQNSLRGRVREILGESAVVTTETMAIGVQKVDELLEVSPDDVRSTFFETIREIFYALRRINPEDLTDSHLEEMMTDADRLTNTLRKIEREIEQRTRPKPPLPGFTITSQ